MSGVDELVAFVRAALDRDEQVAQAVLSLELDGFEWEYAWLRMGRHNGRVTRTTHEPGAPTPRRVLDEAQAKRAILDVALAEDHYLNDREWYGCRAVTENPEIDGPGVPTGQPCTCGRDERIERTARLLAQPYAGQPGWREEWAA